MQKYDSLTKAKRLQMIRSNVVFSKKDKNLSRKNTIYIEKKNYSQTYTKNNSGSNDMSADEKKNEIYIARQINKKLVQRRIRN